MYVSVKEYAKMIDKSDKSIYKMIKDGLVASTKDGKKIQILVDENMIFKIDKTCKKLDVLELRIKNLEDIVFKLSEKKKVIVKKKKPILKSMKKVVKKPLKKRIIKK